MKVKAFDIDVMKEPQRFQHMMKMEIKRAHSDEYREALILLADLYPIIVKWFSQAMRRCEGDKGAAICGFNTAIVNMVATVALSASRDRGPELMDKMMEEINEKAESTKSRIVDE